MSSMKAFLKPLIDKNEVILISDDEDKQDSRNTNVTGRDLNKHRQTSNSAADCNDKKTNCTPPLCEPQVKCEARDLPPLGIDEPLITPVPGNEGETFNRADYQVPPLLVEMTEQSNRIMVEFLSTCMPLITEEDRPLIMRKLKDILSQTNLHYLASDRFRQTVASVASSVQKDSSSTNVYLRIKELADELRSRREKKNKKKGTLPSGPLTAGSNASSAAVTGSSGEDTSDSKCIIPAMCVAFDSVASQARLAALKSPTPSPTNAVPDSTSVVQTETSSVAAGKNDYVSESKKLVGADHEEKCSNGVDTMGETSGVSQKSEKQLRTEKHIKKLEKHLIKLHRAIKKFREEEVDLSCDDINSAYIQEDRFKKKAVAVWRKICELEHRRAITGCEREKKFHYKGTRFVEINTKVEKLVNKRRIFPDFKDILDVVQSENEANGLGLNSKEEKDLAQDVFQEVGRELQKRRQRDELADALAYLEDGPGSAFTGDPAESDKELLKKLENNAKLSRRKIDEVIEVYVTKQEELKLEAKEVEQDNCDQSPKPSDDSGSEDEDEDDNDDDLRAPCESLLENDTSLSESPVEQEKTKLDPQEGKQDICDLSSASNNGSEVEDSEDEGENCKEEKYSRFIEEDCLGNDRSLNEADEADAANAKEEEADAKEEADAEATCRVDSPITVEDRESSSWLLADGDSCSVLEGGLHVEERADCRDSSLATGLGQKRLFLGTETSCGAIGSHKEVPQLPTKKQECSLKKRSLPEADVITILSDDEEPLHPPAKVPKLCEHVYL
ncbi:death domain-associated protein 6-like isoform X4 [Dermacentor albipictus]|uniref:death domain-associated protein 6-like isoform X4 n=1 Tax=Dermacentor albipictus TaxID=60249 RepID=UPI0031FD565E